jgi:signal transduction histidine kinase
MASATNSRAPKTTPNLDALADPVAHAVQAAPVPLLVLRLPQFERIAWREGKRAAQRLERKTTVAFLNACRRVLRTGDLTGHDAGSDVFVIAMTAPSREARIPSSIDCRSALERVAAEMSCTVDMRVETGWTLLRRFDLAAGLGHEIELALERGARDRERYEFFAAIGHELRTPLTSIRGYLETLLDDGVDAATARRFLDTARREALRMGRLLEGMFEFSLLDLSADALLGRGCPLAQQIDMACEVVRPLAERRAIRVERGRCEELAVCIEADACLQLLVNLLDNAIKYGRDGGRVAISLRVYGEDAVLYVDDDGPGIAPAERESIFALRARGSQTGGRPGTGIGLAIVKMIAERCGGTICVGESPLGGARFEVTLPLQDNRVRVS